MTSSEVPMASGIGSFRQQGEGGDDHEAAADAEQPGEEPDRGARPARTVTTVRASSRGRTPRRRRPSVAAARRRARGCSPTLVQVGQPVSMRQAATTTRPAKPSSSTSGSRSLVEGGAGERAADAGQAEHDAGADPHPPGPPVRCPCRRAAAMPTRSRLVAVAACGVLAGGVDEDGHGQDRAAAAERAEGEADQEPEGRGEEGAHGSAVSSGGAAASTGSPPSAHAP